MTAVVTAKQAASLRDQKPPSSVKRPLMHIPIETIKDTSRNWARIWGHLSRTRTTVTWRLMSAGKMRCFAFATRPSFEGTLTVAIRGSAWVHGSIAGGTGSVGECGLGEDGSIRCFVFLGSGPEFSQLHVSWTNLRAKPILTKLTTKSVISGLI
jgi:hypothetical protein